MIATAAAVDDATGVHPSYYLANPADKYTLLSVTASTVPASPAPASRTYSGRMPSASFASGAVACCGVDNRGVALYKDLVISHTLDGRLVATDKETGQVKWQRQVADPKHV